MVILKAFKDELEARLMVMMMEEKNQTRKAGYQELYSFVVSVE